MFGPAYKGISIVSATSEAIYTECGATVPFAYNRKEKKLHGERGGFIRYDLNKAKNIIVLDDVITDGGTKFETIKTLSQFPNIKIKAFVVGIDRQEKDENGDFYIDIFSEKTGIPTYALATKNEILNLQQMKYR